MIHASLYLLFIKLISDLFQIARFLSSLNSISQLDFSFAV